MCQTIPFFWRFESYNFETIFTFNLSPINAIFEAEGVLKSFWTQSSILYSTKNWIHRGSNLYILFKNQGATRVATKWPPFCTKNVKSTFWIAYGKCTCNSKTILCTLHPLIPYDMILYHSPWLFQISICYFFKQPARPSCGQLWTMGGLDNWLGCPFSDLKRHLTVILFSHLHPFSRKFWTNVK